MPFWVVLFLSLAAAVVPAGVVFYVNVPGYQNHVKDVGTLPVQGAPGPIVGAGIPVLLFAGGAWLMRRARSKRS